MSQIKIHYFSNFVLRNPAFPINTYFNLLDNYSDEKLLGHYTNEYIREAIRIASPDLKAALDIWLYNPSQYSTEKKETLAISLLKYMARISSRCTPFGIFAGCDVGTISDETKIVLQPKEKFTKQTQFDMHFWVAMLQDLSQRKDVRENLKFYPNDAIYPQGDFYRYIEYKYVKKIREHHISAIEITSLLTSLLTEAKNGITISQMQTLLADDESEKEEALAYIHQLIDFQFLVSELEAQVTGNDEWDRVLKILNKIPSLEKELKALIQCKELIELLDKEVTPKESIYTQIKDLVKELKLPYEDKFLFQTDLNSSNISNTLDKKIVEKTKQVLYFLNGIQKQQPLINQTNFIKTFLRRYETKEIPLTSVLDTETGIGYVQNSKMNDTHPLLESYTFKNKNDYSKSENWTAIDFILEKKLQEAIENNVEEIFLTEKDFPDFNSDLKNCPATFSVMIEVLKKQDSEQIIIESSGGISAAKLLGRFCNINKSVYDLTKEIIQKENELNEELLLAEIAHIPESRTGNILRRPVLRTYEIPYLCNSGVSSEFQIPISDLMISIKNNTIILRSKKLNKEVIPCLSNAHNYGVNGLPIYHFLCDLQSQGSKPIYNFDWGVLENHYTFLPRVNYKDVILSKARWLISKEEIKNFYLLKEIDLENAFSLWKKTKKLPRYVNWVQSDNTLLLDLDKNIGINLFLKSVKGNDKIILEEFLFTGDSLVKNTNGDGFTNQIIVSFYKEKANNND